MPFLIVAAFAGVVGFVAGKGVEGTGNVIKWAVIGGGGYLAAKHFKLI